MALRILLAGLVALRGDANADFFRKLNFHRSRSAAELDGSSSARHAELLKADPPPADSAAVDDEDDADDESSADDVSAADDGNSSDAEAFNVTDEEEEGGGDDPEPVLQPPLANDTNSDFKLSRTLGSHMVLQRAPASAVVWGFAPPSAVVTASFNGTELVSQTGSDGIWRIGLPPTPAGGPHTIAFRVSTGGEQRLDDVLFGDVYVCGGQSNMKYSVGGNEHGDEYAREADDYPDIRLFTVGIARGAGDIRNDLRNVKQPLERASAEAVSHDGIWGYFSAVCWFFGRQIYRSLDRQVPIGLISIAMYGASIERFLPREAAEPCGPRTSGFNYGYIYYAAVAPYTVGPMAVSGFTWYQGESDLGGRPHLTEQNNNYTCTQTALIQHWRQSFQNPDAFFAVVLLSTWIPSGGRAALIPQLREQQRASVAQLRNAAYVTNADHGSGREIHSYRKQYAGARLANAALAIVYGRPINWRSPSYAGARQTGPGTLKVWLSDVPAEGLTLKSPANAHIPEFSLQTCSDKKSPNNCGWARLQFDDRWRKWRRASVSIDADSKTMVLTASKPRRATRILASAYGWGAVPMLEVYRADMEGEDGQLPVLGWNRSLETKDSKAYPGTPLAEGNATHAKPRGCKKMCGGRGGWCKACGVGMACCRRSHEDPEVCASRGCKGFHCCVTVTSALVEGVDFYS